MSTEKPNPGDKGHSKSSNPDDLVVIIIDDGPGDRTVRPARPEVLRDRPPPKPPQQEPPPEQK